MESIKKRNYGFDWLKGVACIAVVLIHYNLPDQAGIIMKTLCRFAVPVFFMVSGFFALSGDGNVCSRDKLFAKIRHILCLVAGAAFFHLIFCVVWNKVMDPGWSIAEYSRTVINLPKIIKLLVTNDPLVYSHLWFLLALLYCYILMILFERRYPAVLVNMFPVFLLGFLIFALWKNVLHIPSASIPLMSDAYLMLFNLFIFRALPFFLAGMWLRKNREMICSHKFSRNGLIILFIFGEALALLERNVFCEAQFYLGTFIAVGAMFLYVLNGGHEFKEDNFLVCIGKDLSMYVYVLHIAVGKVCDLIAAKGFLEDRTMFLYSKMVIVLSFSLMFAYCLFHLNKKMAKKKNLKRFGGS